MTNKIQEANLAMVVSKTFSGLNVNALRYLLPLWIAPLTGVTFRCVFAAVAFWIIGYWAKPETASVKDKIYLFLLGAVGIYGYMFSYLMGLSKTTPVSAAIFTSMQPIWVFILSVFFFNEKATVMKIVGILVGLGGALLCISTQKSDDLASDAFSGNLFCLVSSVIYAVYLILSNRFLKRTGPYTLMRYTFSGAAVSSLIVMAFVGYEASLTTPPLHFWPIALLLFVLIFPTVISYLLIPTGLKYLSTTVVAIYGYLILVVASIVSFLVGQDRFSWEQLGAMLLICVGVYWGLRAMITVVTAMSMIQIPILCMKLQLSPRNNTPIMTAVKGSMQPNTAVVVEPTCWTARIRVRSDISVGTKARRIRSTPISQEGMGVSISRFTIKFNKKMNAPDSKT